LSSSVFRNSYLMRRWAVLLVTLFLLVTDLGVSGNFCKKLGIPEIHSDFLHWTFSSDDTSWVIVSVNSASRIRFTYQQERPTILNLSCFHPQNCTEDPFAADVN